MWGNGDDINVIELSLSHDYITEIPDFEQFIDVISEENVVYNDTNHFSADDCYYQNQYGGPNQPFDVPNIPTFCESDLLLHSLLEEDETNREEYSSVATEKFAAADDNNGTETIPRKRKRGISTTQKGDRSKTLISERKRRNRMKEKLYELRALVPSITKMDKASIIGDAALYVQELQMRAKKLKAEIGSLEESYVDKPQEPFHQPTKKARAVNSYSKSKIIIKMEVAQVGERGFHVKLVCNKGQGMAVSLYKALESFTSLRVESSTLITVDDTFELKFILNAGKLEVNSPILQLWVTEAFLNHGFEFKTSPYP